MNTKVSSTTVPLKQTTTFKTINLRVKSEDIKVEREDAAHSIAYIDIPMRDIDMGRLVGNLLDDLEMKGVARGAAEKAVDAFQNALEDELLIIALRSLVVRDCDIKI